MTALNITARRWSGGWELWNGEDCWTQVAHLAGARQQVMDYLDTIDENNDHSGWEITITPDVSGAAWVRAARQVTEQAALTPKEAPRPVTPHAVPDARPPARTRASPAPGRELEHSAARQPAEYPAALPLSPASTTVAGSSQCRPPIARPCNLPGQYAGTGSGDGLR